MNNRPETIRSKKYVIRTGRSMFVNSLPTRIGLSMGISSFLSYLLSFFFLFNPTTNKGTRSGHFQSFYFGSQLSKKFIRCLLGIVLYRELRQHRFKLSGTERLLNLRDLFACKFVAPFVLSMACVPFEPMPFNFVF